MADEITLRDSVKHVNLEILTQNDNPRFITYLHRGFNYGIYDRNNNPDLSQLMVFTMEARGLSMQEGKSFLDWPQAMKGNKVTFVASMEFNMSRTLYQRSTRTTPLEVKYALGRLGRTSVTLLTSLSRPGDSTPLITQVFTMILIDSVLRKPTPFPQWYTDKFRGKGVLEGTPHVLQQFPRPDKTFVHCIELIWLDTDSNDHTNFASYVKFSLNALHLALRLKNKATTSKAQDGDEGARTDTQTSRQPQKSWHGDPSVVDGISEEIVKCGLNNARMNFLAQSNEGDELNVHVWRRRGEGFVVRFSIEKPDGSRVCQIELEYFGPNSHL